MLRVAVMVSGGGTNLQAIIDAINNKTITNAQIVGVISNNANAYALTRAKDNGIQAMCVSPKDYDDRDKFNDALLEAVKGLNPDLIVLAGFLVKIPEKWCMNTVIELLTYTHHLYHHFAVLDIMDFMCMRQHLKKVLKLQELQFIM